VLGVALPFSFFSFISFHLIFAFFLPSCAALSVSTLRAEEPA
jgi:hypothetical protein